MNASTLNCYSCGAAVSSEAPNCGHCGARLASIACPACFAMMFQGSKFCPQCGSPAVQWESEKTDRLCPSCRVPMLRGKLREVPLHECAKCYGLWLDTASFEHVCRNAEQQAAALGGARPAGGAVALGPIRYVRCPQCNELMHRLNFAHCSGVIVDVCRPHGTWFDANELHRIVHFVRAGGLDRSRAKEKVALAEERRRLQAARVGADRISPYEAPAAHDRDLLTMVVRASGDVLTSWLLR
jgi:Zn-finger nucleic acid-binding protein/RNA polymerase subunit RPABC4/transcription elongation factor Spt4